MENLGVLDQPFNCLACISCWLTLAFLFPITLDKEPEAEVLPEIQEPPEPEPGTPEWEYVEEPIDEVENFFFLLQIFFYITCK